jgi:hypothetical protein
MNKVKMWIGIVGLSVVFVVMAYVEYLALSGAL